MNNAEKREALKSAIGYLRGPDNSFHGYVREILREAAEKIPAGTDLLSVFPLFPSATGPIDKEMLWIRCKYKSEKYAEPVVLEVEAKRVEDVGINPRVFADYVIKACNSHDRLVKFVEKWAGVGEKRLNAPSKTFYNNLIDPEAREILEELGEE